MNTDPLMKLIRMPYANNATSTFIEMIAFDGIKGSFSQLLVNPDFASKLTIALVEQLFKDKPLNNWNGYYASNILEGRNS